MRIRLAELMAQRQTNPRRIELATQGAINARTLYRIKAMDGRPRFFDAELLDALCQVLEVGPGDLLEHEPVDLSGGAVTLTVPAASGARKRKR
jgi:DNA-binding Xre family transcriptional regulator